MTTLSEDLDRITSILYKTFEYPGIQRDYDSSFGKIRDILNRYGIIENPKDLRIMFTLCMQEFFELIPQEQWKLNDPLFIKQSEEYGIKKFRDRIIELVS